MRTPSRVRSRRRILSAAPLLALSALACAVRVPGETRFDAEARREEIRPLVLSPGEALTLETSFGTIEVRAGDGAPELRASLSARGRTDEEAQAMLQRATLVVERGPDGTRARLESEPLVVHEDGLHAELSAQVSFVATVPPGTPVRASSRSGALRTHGPLGSVDLETQFGAIAIDQAEGRVRAESRSGQIRVGRARGDEIVLKSGFGAIRADDLSARRTTLGTGSGEIELEALEGEELALETGFGSIRAGRVRGALRARSGSGSIRLEDTRGPLEVVSNFGAITVAGVLDSLSVESGSGDVRVTAEPGSRVDPAWTLKASFGAVTLDVPDGLDCRLDARAGFGRVECSLPVTMEAGGSRDRKALVGTLGAGGGPVTLSSGSGTVSIRRR